MSFPPKIKPASIVNAYLFYAKRLLQFENSPIQTTRSLDDLVIAASVCLCVKEAWQAWLDELGRYLNKPLKAFSDLRLPENSSHPEIALLLSIHQAPENWLTDVLRCLEPRVQTTMALPESHSSEVLGAEESVPGRINLIALESGSLKGDQISQQSKMDAAFFNRLLDGFKDYIHQVRARQEEW